MKSEKLFKTFYAHMVSSFESWACEICFHPFCADGKARKITVRESTNKSHLLKVDMEGWCNKFHCKRAPRLFGVTLFEQFSGKRRKSFSESVCSTAIMSPNRQRTKKAEFMKNQFARIAPLIAASVALVLLHFKPNETSN